MKYTTPNYEVEAIETKDVITASTAVKVNGVTVGSLNVVKDIDENGNEVEVQRFLVPDVSILL